MENYIICYAEEEELQEKGKGGAPQTKLHMAAPRKAEGRARSSEEPKASEVAPQESAEGPRWSSTAVPAKRHVAAPRKPERRARPSEEKKATRQHPEKPSRAKEASPQKSKDGSTREEAPDEKARNRR